MGARDGAAAALLATVIVGCVATEAPPPTRGYVVNGPPPAPIADARPPSPTPGATWVEGYWHWAGVHYAWIPGHWESPPAGAAWRAPRYTRVNGDYVYEPGAWTSPAAAPAPPPRVRTIR